MGHKQRKFTFFLRTERKKWSKTGAFARHIHVHLSIGSTPRGSAFAVWVARRSKHTCTPQYREYPPRARLSLSGLRDGPNIHVHLSIGSTPRGSAFAVWVARRSKHTCTSQYRKYPHGARLSLSGLRDGPNIHVHLSIGSTPRGSASAVWVARRSKHTCTSQYREYPPGLGFRCLGYATVQTYMYTSV